MTQDDAWAMYWHAVKTVMWCAIWASIFAAVGATIVAVALDSAGLAAASAICWGMFGAAMSLVARVVGVSW